MSSEESVETPELNAGQVEETKPAHAAIVPPARIHMDQIDAISTPQGVILFALTEGGEIWQYTTFGGQGQWTPILTPEAPPEEV